MQLRMTGNHPLHTIPGVLHIPLIPALLAAALYAAGTAGAQAGQATAPKPPSLSPKPPAPSFYREVLPIFRSACIGCHSSEMPVNGLSLGSYAELMKGGKNGSSVVPGKSAESRLVKMLTGAIQPKMPPGPGLKQGTIDRIRLWIDAGAKEDAPPQDVRPAASGRIAAKSNPTARGSVGSSAPRPVPATIAGKVLAVPPPVASLAFSPDGKTLAVGTYRQVLFVDTETRRVVRTWAGHADAVRALVFTADGKTLAAGGGTPGVGGEVRFWDVAAGRETRVLGEHADVVNGLAFSPDGGKIASGSADKTIKVWDIAAAKALWTMRDHADTVYGVAWSPAGKYVVSCSADKSLKVWDADTGKRIYSIVGHEDVVYDVEFSKDGKSLVSTGADKTTRLWYFGDKSSPPGRSVGTHDHAVLCGTFSPDAGLVATGSADKTVRIWSPGETTAKATLKDAKDWVYVVRFSPDGKRLAAGTWDGTVLIWTVPEGKSEAKVEGTLSTLVPSR